MCPPSGPFYRVAGMSYVRYANLCADFLRSVMKEPFKTKAAQRQVVFFRTSPVVNGKQEAQIYYDTVGIPKTAPAPSSAP
ncbi:ATP synthase subunit epsilon, mitochondrial [Tetrabaena socialis]|uniref:ATP synthase subunit epsilon, mitochondrial n=1 Tax=Tetrabaena socialis TaxID=47790 RepID=A0A2J7ZWJ1_9CHLO|nr:ATP synthase subunit epsilon, mitochondrial [Tetrabaena socialis]|eukprot:PNH04629.1 ATP synthase subunit epsilon, mitochondrial [Tetrabaena socialis]